MGANAVAEAARAAMRRAVKDLMVDICEGGIKDGKDAKTVSRFERTQRVAVSADPPAPMLRGSRRARCCKRVRWCKPRDQSAYKIDFNPSFKHSQANQRLLGILVRQGGYQKGASLTCVVEP